MTLFAKQNTNRFVHIIVLIFAVFIIIYGVAFDLPSIDGGLIADPKRYVFF